MRICAFDIKLKNNYSFFPFYKMLLRKEQIDWVYAILEEIFVSCFPHRVHSIAVGSGCVSLEPYRLYAFDLFPLFYFISLGANSYLESELNFCIWFWLKHDKNASTTMTLSRMRSTRMKQKAQRTQIILSFWQSHCLFKIIAQHKSSSIAEIQILKLLR